MTFSPVYLNETDSTNTQCKLLAKNGAPHGTVVFAKHQTAGRGRLGRSFFSPDNAGLYCSVLIREGINMEHIGLVTPCAAVAAARAVEKLSGAKADIKWVNDIYICGKKVCGILTEASLPDFLVIGIGINLRSVKNTFPDELLDIVTSIEDETGRIFTPSEMADALLTELSGIVENTQNKDFLCEYRERSCLIGNEVTVLTGNETYPALVTGIDDSAGLMIRLPSGEERILRTGEVSVRV